MARATTIFLLSALIALCAASESAAQREFEFDVYTVLASNYRHGVGDDLLLTKSCIKSLPFTSYALLNKVEVKPLIGRTAQIPVPGQSTLNIQPRVFYGDAAFVHVWLTGSDSGFSFYDHNNSVSILTGPSFKIESGDMICLVGPSTRWGTLIFVIHSDVEGLDSRSVTTRH